MLLRTYAVPKLVLTPVTPVPILESLLEFDLDGAFRAVRGALMEGSFFSRVSFFMELTDLFELMLNEVL